MENTTGRMATGLRALARSNGNAEYSCAMLAFYDYLVLNEGKSHKEARQFCEQAMSLMDSVDLPPAEGE